MFSLSWSSVSSVLSCIFLCLWATARSDSCKCKITDLHAVCVSHKNICFIHLKSNTSKRKSANNYIFGWRQMTGMTCRNCGKTGAEDMGRWREVNYFKLHLWVRARTKGRNYFLLNQLNQLKLNQAFQFENGVSVWTWSFSSKMALLIKNGVLFRKRRLLPENGVFGPEMASLES